VQSIEEVLVEIDDHSSVAAFPKTTPNDEKSG
jgi:hypothetical protein